MTDRIDLPWTTPPLSLNDRHHWRKKAELTAVIRRVTARLSVAAHPRGSALVTLHYQPKDNRHRDEQNLHGTLKPAVDGLVDAGVLLNGDSSRWVDTRCVIHEAEKGAPARLWLEIGDRP